MRAPVGVPIEIPVPANRSAEFVSWLAFPASRLRPPQSPAVVAGQTPEDLGTKTEPQLGTGSVIALRLVSSAPVDLSLPFWTVIVPARIPDIAASASEKLPLVSMVHSTHMPCSAH